MLQNRVWSQSFLVFINFKNIANPKIEGTHNPIKIADSFSPLNHNSSENIRDENAAISIRISEVVSFFNMLSLWLYINIRLIKAK